ncbi:MAG: phage baseplate protein [Fusobacterium sp.]|mgnify:CR=1 FL=1|uniref:phage baseplate protein n=1 Tax=Fusobacterium sp. TaxID=68766 RepID=UPI003991E758
MLDFSVTSLMNKLDNKGVMNKIKKFLGEKTILLNDIPLELVFDLSQSLSSDIPTTTLDNGSNYADNISNSPADFTFRVQATGNDHRKIFDEVLNMRKKREPVTLFVDELYTNLGIENVTREVKTLTYTEFTISLKEMEFAYLEMIPAPPAKKVTKKTSKINTGKESWEGELKSESIKLRGEK